MNVNTQAWHYIRHNQTTRVPRRHIFIDTEARQVRDRRGWTQTWRCGVAIFRHAGKGKPATERTQVFTSPADLWREVTGYVPKRGRVVLWTHNLGYDVRTSKALVLLPAMGWVLQAFNMTPGGTWLAWRRGDQSMVMVDSAAVFTTTVAAVATSLGVDPIPLPAHTDSDDRWIRRCTRDAVVLRTAIVAYLDKIETDDLGNWQLTGTGQSWAAFRHKHLTHDMLVHWDGDARAAERRAMWTGRCEAYWHGRLSGVRVDEWDMTLAYPRIAATHDIPVALACGFGAGEDLNRWLDRPGYTVLAEVEVSTDEALVPTERDGRIAWPVGRFRTVLWEPELRLLLERGASVATVRGWAYKAAPALASWARWIGRELTAPDPASPAWWKIICKHWARALIGRMAMSYRTWERVGTLAHVDISRSSYVDLDTGQTGECIQVGREVFVATETTEWPESMPQVTGYIMSACRAVLTRLLLAAGDRTVLYADTDSLLTTGEHFALMETLAARHPETGLRLKRSWRSVEIRGPRQIVTGERVRVAGVPIKAVRMPDGTLQGEVWESLLASVAHRRSTSVRITPRHWVLRAADARRAEGADGWTVPHVVGESTPVGLSAGLD